jgi:hypothetical protein
VRGAAFHPMCAGNLTPNNLVLVYQSRAHRHALVVNGVHNETEVQKGTHKLITNSHVSRSQHQCSGHRFSASDSMRNWLRMTYVMLSSGKQVHIDRPSNYNLRLSTRYRSAELQPTVEAKLLSAQYEVYKVTLKLRSSAIITKGSKENLPY